MNYKTKIIIKSFTNPDKFYKIALKDDNTYMCSCPAWIFHKIRPCKHIRALGELNNLQKLIINSDKAILKIDGDDWYTISKEEIKEESIGEK